MFNLKRIKWKKVVLNLRSYAGLSAREVEEITGVKQDKLYKMTGYNSYKLSWEEGNALLDLHYDTCEALHKFRLLVIAS